jgi:Uma2 family endonuclease
MQPTVPPAEWAPELPGLPPGSQLPDHTQLPDTDGRPMESYQQPPQSSILTESLWPRLLELYPNGHFSVGQDAGIYFQYTNPPLNGCRAPDWFVVLGVPPVTNAPYRRSYVMWHERVPPLLIIEYVSGDGAEERDATPEQGKFWIYEQVLRTRYYVIFDAAGRILEAYELIDWHYRPMTPNAERRYLIEPLRIELGLWDDVYQGMDLPWVRFWDADTGKIMLSGEERAIEAYAEAQAANRRANEAREATNEAREEAQAANRRANEAEERAQRLAERLRAMGIDPDA